MAYGIFLDRGLNLCPLRWQLDSQPLGHQGSPDISTQSATIPFALGMRLCVCAVVSRVQLFATLWTVARQAPLSMEFSRQECWSGLPFPPPEDLLDPGIKPTSSVSPVLAGGFFTTAPPGKLGHDVSGGAGEAMREEKFFFLDSGVLSPQASVVNAASQTQLGEGSSLETFSQP